MEDWEGAEATSGGRNILVSECELQLWVLCAFPSAWEDQDPGDGVEAVPTTSFVAALSASGLGQAGFGRAL